MGSQYGKYDSSPQLRLSTLSSHHRSYTTEPMSSPILTTSSIMSNQVDWNVENEDVSINSPDLENKLVLDFDKY